MIARLRRVAVTGLLTAIAAGCGSPATSTGAPSTAVGQPASAAAAAPLTVYAAASLKGALDKVKPAWELRHPRSPLTFSADSSAALETQIEQGAPADVFLSADTTNPGKLVDKGLADGAAVTYAGNILTIVVPASNPAHIEGPADLARPGVRIIAAGDDVPITKYEAQVVAKLGELPDASPGFATAFSANVVSREDNVKAVVAKVELGEGDAAIVYATDARASTKLATVALPPEANVAATYAGVVVKAGHTAAAHEFLDWLAGPEGQAILGTLGFLPPD